MAEVIDIITRLGYQADTKEVEQAYKAIENNVKAIDDNTKSIQRLEALRDKTDKANLARLAQIERAILNRNKAINNEINLIKAEVAANERLKSSINSNIQFLNNLTKTQTTFVNGQGKLVQSTDKSAMAVLNFSRVIQDLPYGIQGVANNIDPLVQSLGGSAGLSLGVSIVTSLLVVFGEQLFKTSQAAQEAEEANAKYKKSLDDIEESARNSAQGEIARIQVLTRIAADNTNSLENRNKAINELQKSYPAYFGNLDREILLNGQATAAINEATQALLKRAAAQAAEKKFAAASEQVYDLTLKQRKALEEVNKQEAKRQTLTSVALANPNNARLQNAATAAIRAEERAQKDLNSIIELNNNARKEQKQFLDDAVNFAKQAGDAFFDPANPDKPKGASLSAVKSLQNQQDEYEKALEAFRKFSIENQGKFNEEMEKDLAEKAKAIGELLGELERSFNEGLAESLNPGDTAGLNGGASALNAQLLNQQAITDKQKKDDEEADKKRKEVFKQRIEATKEFAQSIFQIMSDLNARQLALLDIEMDARKQRVNEAVRLAEYGNTEILRTEQERLNKLQEEREKIARRQLVINAAMQASSASLAVVQAIETITNAGTKGDPYTIAFRIAAAVAALAAGVLSIKTAVQGSFAEGVVDYKGKGTGTSDSNLVRISKGESVITAKATQQYAHILEAMNANKPIPIPFTAMPYRHQSSENAELHKEIKALREAFESNGINVKTNVTNGHIATIVESQRKFNNARWK